MDHTQNSRKTDVALSAAIFLASLVYLSTFYDYGIELLDEGYLVACTTRVLHGQVSYIDFQNNYGPGRHYFFAALFKLFGDTLLVTRAAWVVLYAFAGVAAYFIARRAVKPGYAALAGVIVVLMRCPWHKTFFVFLPLPLIWACFIYLDRKNRMILVLCGFVTSLVAIIRHDIGIYGYLSFSLVLSSTYFEKRLYRETLKDIFVYSASTLLFFSPFPLYYLWRGYLLEMLNQYLFSGVRDVSASTVPFPASPIVLLFILPIAVYAAAACMLIYRAYKSRFDRHDLYTLLLVVFGALIYIQLLNRSDLAHLWQIFPPVCLLLFFLWSDAVKSGIGRSAKVLLTTATGLIFACYLAVYFQPSNPQTPPFVLHQSDIVTLDNSRARVKIPKGYAQSITEVVDTVRRNTKDGDYILAVPDIPMFYFLCDRTNPLRYDLLRPGIADKPELQEAVVNTLRGKDVPYMIFNEGEVWDNRPERKFKNRASIIYGYLISNYTLVERSGPFSVWRKNQSAK